ncbi:MAG: lysine--tRNA ligase [Planctomycetota bacterium]|nr:MAG: lysine--tRNA ligase [Planctomycetota bacterium]
MAQDYRQVRLGKLEDLVAAGVHPHPERYERTHTLAEAAALDETVRGVRVAGRVIAKRDMGKNVFVKLQDFDGALQVMLARDALAEDPEESARQHKLFSKKVDLWDFVGVEGDMFRTRTGELTVRARGWSFLGKCLQPPPEKRLGIHDTELAWRQRYLDLVTNPQSRERFRLRTALVRAIRAALDREGFQEVETPVLCNKASGALARPFVSHHNALDMPVVLRIAPETYLKRLIVAGYDRVYEFARCFRNEGMDPSHLQDFTMLEYYVAYWNYEDNMRFTERLLREVIQEALGTLRIERGGRTIDFSGEWPRRSLREVIEEHAGIDIDAHPDADSLRAAIVARGVELENPGAGRGSLIDQLYKKTARGQLIQPTFIIRHPRDLSPLARASDDDPRTVDRFQLVVDTWEVVNAYSELVDPIDQRERLVEQAGLKAAGDDEAMELDEDYLLAMEHGMPPISGWGMGIDRIVALLSDAPNLRDVVWFPLMKPLGNIGGAPRTVLWAGEEALALGLYLADPPWLEVYALDGERVRHVSRGQQQPNKKARKKGEEGVLAFLRERARALANEGIGRELFVGEGRPLAALHELLPAVGGVGLADLLARLSESKFLAVENQARALARYVAALRSEVEA